MQVHVLSFCITRYGFFNPVPSKPSKRPPAKIYERLGARYDRRAPRERSSLGRLRERNIKIRQNMRHNQLQQSGGIESPGAET